MKQYEIVDDAESSADSWSRRPRFSIAVKARDPEAAYRKVFRNPRIKFCIPICRQSGMYGTMPMAEVGGMMFYARIIGL